MRLRRVQQSPSWSRFGVALAAVIVVAGVATPVTASAEPAGGGAAEVTESPAVAHGTSVPLRSLPQAKAQGPDTSSTQPLLPVPAPPVKRDRATAPAALQGPSKARAAGTTPPDLMQNFEGLGDGLVGPQGVFQMTGAPPDPNGDVGPNHYVQMVNHSLAVFSKTGTVLYGPVFSNSLWSGFGGLCESENQGDPIVAYDALADRWVLSQFATQFGGPDYECVAVSTTPDPLGTYALYAFEYDHMNDYPKMGVWPDGYYMTYNMYDSTSGDFLGGKVCALDRAKMLANQPASQQCVDFEQPSLLPSDLDGTTPPPPGAPNYILGESWTAPNQLALYRFHVDWTDPTATRMEGPAEIPVASYAPACETTYRGRCIPQARTETKLESLNYRMMFRLAYRNYGSHQSLVSNFTVSATDDTDGQTAVRWFELRSLDAAAPVVHQQGSYAPDSDYRWMGSIAMDRDQNMALGYSRSSASTSPAIGYTGRLSTDPPGILQPERTVPLAENGSQLSLARWGDYTAMQVDPVDDCTFWYTNQYVPTDGLFNWRTRIVSFKYPSCKVPQTIAFASPPSTSVKAKTVELSASASSGLPVSFTSLTPGVCSVAGSTVTLIQGGTCTIRASQPGNQMYAAAVMSQSFSVTKMPQGQRSGTIPRTLRNPGRTVVNPSGARTVQGQPLSAQVAAVLPRGQLRCLSTKQGPNRKVTVLVTGQCAMRVRVIYTAEGNGKVLPYRKIVWYRLKRTAAR